MTVRPLSVLLSCAALGLAACGGSDDNNNTGSGAKDPVAAAQEYLKAFIDGDFEKACSYIAEQSKKQIEKAGSCKDVLAKASAAVKGTDASMVGAKVAPGKISGNTGTIVVTTKGGTKIKIPVLIEDGRWKLNSAGS